VITVLQGKTQKIEISPDSPTVIIGERINPTGRPSLAEALKKDDWELIRQEAISQVEQGAAVIDVNVGVPGLDEIALLPRAVRVVAEAVDVPLCLDSSNHKALEAALKVCPGRPLINSTTGEEKALNTILPLAKASGAAVIALCHDEKGIINDPETRLKVAEKIANKARSYGLQEADLLIDPLVLSVGAEAKSAIVSLKTTLLISEKLGLNLTLGASNVSFGLPTRHLINNSFLAMAIWCGVNAPLANPASKGVVETILAADLLKGKDPYAGRYIRHYRKSQQK